jgi:hypothetical protein
MKKQLNKQKTPEASIDHYFSDQERHHQPQAPTDQRPHGGEESWPFIGTWPGGRFQRVRRSHEIVPPSNNRPLLGAIAADISFGVIHDRASGLNFLQPQKLTIHLAYAFLAGLGRRWQKVHPSALQCARRSGLEN